MGDTYEWTDAAIKAHMELVGKRMQKKLRRVRFWMGFWWVFVGLGILALVLGGAMAPKPGMPIWVPFIVPTLLTLAGISKMIWRW